MNKDPRNTNVSTRFLLGAVLVFGLTFIANYTLAYTSPGKPSGFVNDFASVISVPDRQKIEGRLLALQNSSGVQVAVVTVSSLGDETVETYAVKLFEEWGIGQKGKDNGLLILVAPAEREARIEVGYGLEGTVTDLQSGNIIKKVMIPAFKEGKYGDGISGAVDAVAAVIMKSPEAAQYSVTLKPDNQSKWDFNPFLVYFLIIIILNALSRFLGKTKSWWLGGVIGAGIGAIIGIIAASLYAGIASTIILTIIGLIFDFIVSRHPPGSGGKSGGIWPIFFGGGRGGSSVGGFGGFGGGMSGGGGASGRW